MYFLDANAFYSYFGRSKLAMTSSPVDENELTAYLDRQKDKSLPTSVYIEIITHFRKSPKLLKEILKFSRDKRLLLYNNIPNYVVDTDEIACVSIMDEKSLYSYADKLLRRKIEIESKFTLVFFEITRDLYAHYKLESATELSEGNKSSILNYIGRNGFKEYGGILDEKIQKELASGYADNKEQNVLKNFYIHELNEACLFIDIIIAGCIACKDEDSDLVKCIQGIYHNKISLGMDGSNGTMPCIVDTLATDTRFLSDAKQRIANMFKKGHYTDSQIAYLRDVMFTAWFNRGQKLQKNDIFDMFCVGCLDYKDTSENECILIDSSSYIISFDKRMKHYLGIVRPRNLQIIEKIQSE
jgi:hypothetical protein